MKFEVITQEQGDDKTLAIRHPGNHELITSVNLEGAPNIGPIREALMQECQLGSAACGASVDLRNDPEVTCSMNICSFRPGFKIL